MKTYEHFRSVFAFISILYSLVTLSQTRLCPNVNIEDNQLNNPIVWRNQPQIHVVNWINDNLCNNVQECYGNDNNNLEKSEHFPQLCPLYVQFGDPIYFVSGPGEKDFLNPIAVSQRDFYNCSLITYPYYWKVTTFPKRHSLKVPLKFLFPSDHHFMQIPFLGSPGCETGFRLKVTVRTQDCTVSSYPNKPCFDNGYCVFINDKGGDKLNNGNETGQNCSLKNPNDLVNQEGLQIFTCKCRVPYKGRYCEDYDACWNHACQNGGLCNDLRKGINNREYTCTCQINYIGKHCEYVKSCFEGLCQNGGQCFYDTTRPAHFQCICLPGFSGNRCEITTGPERQYLDNITGNLIREQEARDKALQEGGQDMIQTLDNMGVNSSRLSYPRILIAPFIYRNMTAPSTCNPAQTGADCFECGCPHSGVCIRESPQGPNTCFCPPGVSGPSCKTLAGVCTYAQPCSNGGTCLERMAGGKANDKESDQEDEDALVFPAPGENAPPQPTISWSLLTATPMPQSLVTTGNSNLGDSSSTTKQAYICLCSKGYYGYNCDTKSKDGRVCTTSDCCKDGEGEIVGPGMDKKPFIGQVVCHNGGTIVNENTCRCPRGFSGNQCEISQPVEAVLPGGIIQTGQQYTTTNVPAPSTSLIAKEGVCVDNYECQNGGECLKKMLPDGNTDNKCLCQLSYGGNICENSIDLTNPLFTGTSFINYDQPIVWDNGRITFETQIVPLKDDGTIFKVVNSGQNPPNTNVTFHLYMKDGKLNYDVIHVPTGTILAHVRSHNTDLNGRKSTITIENNLVPGTNRLGSVALSVDNDRAQSRDVISVVNNTLPSYNVEIKMLPKSEIFIGAPSRESVLKTKDEMNNGKETNFQGSILSFSINGRPIKLIKDATNGLGVINNTPGTCENMCRNGAQCMTEGWRSFCQCPEGFQGAFCESRSCDHCLNGGMCIDLRGNDNYACLCPYGWTGINCDQKLDIDVKNTFKFNGMKFGYPSYVTFAPLSPSIQNDFEIKFKFIIDERESAVWKNSLLMFAGQNTAQSSRNPYIAVGLQNGYVVFRYDLANEGENEMRELVSPQPLDRSIPSHEVRFGRNRQDSWLNVDSQQAVIDKSQSNARLDIWNGLFVGGYNTFLMRLLPRGASVFRNGFKGCIYDIYIRNGPTELKTILDSGAHLTQSLNVLPCFKESLCSSASCQNNGVCMELGANYHCRCTPQYAGPTCDMINPQFSTTTISNAIQTNIGGIIIPGSQSISPATDMQTISSTSIDSFSRNQCELIIDNSLNEAFSVNIKFAGNPDTDQIIIILNIMAENKSLYKLTFVLDFRPLINIKKGETLAIKDDVFILPLNNSMTIRNFTLSKIKSKLTINVNDVIHDLQVNITNHEIIHSLSLGLGNLNQNATSESIFNANKKFCYKTAELIIQNSVINIEDYFNCNMIQKCTN